uniref:Peptidase M41 domain-containing protein n=1 Tax=viral metagenome TaxID=1070528 RepID=A0A6C0HYJ4_9ZZZZ
MIDTEVQEIVEKAYKTCKQTLSSNWGLVKKLVALLLVEETVNAETLLTLQSS